LSRPCNDYEGIFVTAEDNCNGVQLWASDTHVSGGCQGRIIRMYYAQDACGNIDSTMQIITLVDTELPTLENPTQDTTIIECGMPMPEYSPIWSDNCDDELELISGVQMVETGCDKVYTYAYSATDNCENTASAGHVVIVRDTQAPTWNEGAASDTITVQCGTATNIEAPTASDACSEVTIVPSYELVSGNCPANYTEIFSWVAQDACGNTSAPITIVVNHQDVNAPYATSTPEGGQYSCDTQVPFEEPTFGDFCSEVSVAFNDTIIAGNCPNSYTIVRSWTPSDACGNVGETVTVSYFVYDNVAPSFNNHPADEYYQCQPADWSPATVTASDNCEGDVTVIPTVSADVDSCGNGVIVVTYVATDLCENDSTISYRVYIEDTTDPTFDSTPEELIVLNCDQEIPAADELTASDNCDNNVDITFVENVTPGVELIENAVSACSLITPDINLSGNCKTYYNNKNWALWLGSMPPVHRYFTVSSGYLYTMNDGSLKLVATFVNSTTPALGGFTASVTFANPLDWAQWSTQAFMTSFKADCGGVGANHPDWTYYLLQAGSGAELTGYGSYAGSSLDLAHAPSNKYFGFQLGEGANNLTPGYGIGGWFTYSGTILVDGNPLMSGTAGGAGDFAINLDCCPKTIVHRCWTATDCSNNSVSVCQTIRYEGSNTAAPQAPTTEIVRVNTASSLDIVSVFPNPSAETAEMRVVSQEDAKIMVDVLDMTGRRVIAVYQGDVEAGQTYRFNINSRELSNGLYQIRVTSDKAVATKQMNVVR
jgi:hypothetical protein